MTDHRTAAHGQRAHAVRLEWGPTGAAAIATGAHIAVVVDVLSFTTTLSVAVERGATVYPYRWRDASAEEYAAARDATLAVGRSRAGPGDVSLSPASLARAEGIDRLVLPSPNGSSICFGLAEPGVEVVGACLRNRSVVARWLAPRVAAGERLAVVAAGERWPDGTLRPDVEDLWGAGAVLSALEDLGIAGFSPEAQHAAASYRAVEPGIGERLLACASGQELVAGGYADDVRLAGEVDVSSAVPVLRGEAFLAAPPG